MPRPYREMPPYDDLDPLPVPMPDEDDDDDETEDDADDIEGNGAALYPLSEHLGFG
jgi:hypothetical protein